MLNFTNFVVETTPELDFSWFKEKKKSIIPSVLLFWIYYLLLDGFSRAAFLAMWVTVYMA